MIALFNKIKLAKIIRIKQTKRITCTKEIINTTKHKNNKTKKSSNKNNSNPSKNLVDRLPRIVYFSYFVKSEF